MMYLKQEAPIFIGTMEDYENSRRNEMLCQDYADMLDNNYFFQSMVEDAYWSKSGPQPADFFARMVEQAVKDKIVLIDMETFDYEEYFYNLYEHTEKGLS
jgi:hypothetical protein